MRLNSWSLVLTVWVAAFSFTAFFTPSPTLASKQHRDTTTPIEGEMILIPGGGWHSGPSCNSVYFRNGLPMGWVDIAVGFRCAADAPSPEQSNSKETGAD